MTCQVLSDKPNVRGRGKGRRSVYALAAEREAQKEQTIRAYAQTIVEQARQIADLRRQLAVSVNSRRGQK